MLEAMGKYGANMVSDSMDEPAPQMQPAGGPRMGGQQQQAQPVTIDYGGAAQRKPAGSSQMLGIDDEELKRILMSLRGY